MRLPQRKRPDGNLLPGRARTLPEPQTKRLRSTSRTFHPRCFVCGPANPAGLGLSFSVTADGAVEAEFIGSHVFEGYSGILHGGLVTALLDGAMLHCLFASGCVAVTAELTVRFRHSVNADEKAIVRGWRIQSAGPLHWLKAEVHQRGIRMASASATFFDERDGENDGRLSALGGGSLRE